MSHLPLLSIVNFLPLAGALIILVGSRGDSEARARSARVLAFGTTVVNLIFALVVWARFDGTSSAFQFIEQARGSGAASPIASASTAYPSSSSCSLPD